MFPEGAIFTQDINEVIEIIPEDKYDEVLSSMETRPKRDNTGVGIDQLVNSFYGKTYKSDFFVNEGTRVKR